MTVDARGFREGDPEVFRGLLQAHGSLVESVVRAYAVDGDHAEDLFQQVWVRVYEKRGTYGGSGAFRGWLHRVATGVCIGDFHKRKAYRHRLARLSWLRWQGDATGVGSDPMAGLESEQRQATIHRALGHLSPREHQAVTLRIVEGRRPAEVAAAMGVKEATVRSLIRHGIQRLRHILEAG